MGREIGTRGWRAALSARVVVLVGAVLGIVCVLSVAVAGPARADDNSDGPQSGQDDSGHKSAPATYQSTPCTKTARACVDLEKQQAWLLDPQGTVLRGPVPISSGGPGQETPTGTFKVQWKDKDHKSTESKDAQGNPAPMPYSVFFANGGVAFHGGSLTRASAGCVHLDDADAQAFYNALKLGDEVQVH